MNEKTKAQINQQISNQNRQSMHGSIGVIISFNKEKNTATVAVTENDTDALREVLTDVPFPVTLGVQTVIPEPGLLCWIDFANGKITSPLITNIYNHRYEQFQYQKQHMTRFTLPSSLLD